MESLARFVVALFISLILLGTFVGIFIAWFFKSSWLFAWVSGIAFTLFTFWGYVSLAKNSTMK